MKRPWRDESESINQIFLTTTTITYFCFPLKSFLETFLCRVRRTLVSGKLSLLNMDFWTECLGGLILKSHARKIDDDDDDDDVP